MFVFYLTFLFTNVVGISDKYEKSYYWNLMSYDIDGVKYTSDSDYEHKVGSFYAVDELEDNEKFFIQKNFVPYSMKYGIRYYVFSVPRTRPGIPYTLNFFEPDYYSDKLDPELKPFPNSKEAKEIISVYGLTNSGCFALSFVDTGFIDIPGQRKQVKPPRLMSYHDVNYKPAFSYEIDKSLLRDGVSSGLRSTVVNSEYPCIKTYMYISDEYSNDVIAFSVQKQKFSKVHRSRNGDEAWTFPVPANIVHLIKEGYFFSDYAAESYEHYKKFYDQRNQGGQDDTSVTNLDTYLNPKGVIYSLGSGIVFFTNVDRTKLFCWHVYKPLTDENVVLLTEASDDNDFYIADVKVAGFYFGMIVNRFRRNDSQIYDSKNINFELYESKYHKLVANTNCANEGEKRK